MSTDENDIVLDPFNGTGTTALAAKRLGRNFIGFDLSKEYVDITNSKLELEKPNSKIGDRFVSFYLDEVITLRDEDWEYLKDYFYIPNNPVEIDTISIKLKNKIHISTPLKNGKSELYSNQIIDNLDSFKNQYKAEHKILTLFDKNNECKI